MYLYIFTYMLIHKYPLHIYIYVCTKTYIYLHIYMYVHTFPVFIGVHFGSLGVVGGVCIVMAYI